MIEVNAGQLDALSRDPEVGQLTADAVVQPTLAVTTQSTGAEQAWAGLDGIGRVTGRGIGIAVIDSGIASHHDLEDRVVVSVDFTEGGGRGEDEYGHGTHVAGSLPATTAGGTGGTPISGLWRRCRSTSGTPGSRPRRTSSICVS